MLCKQKSIILFLIICRYLTRLIQDLSVLTISCKYYLCRHMFSQSCLLGLTDSIALLKYTWYLKMHNLYVKLVSLRQLFSALFRSLESPVVFSWNRRSVSLNSIVVQGFRDFLRNHLEYFSPRCQKINVSLVGSF